MEMIKQLLAQSRRTMLLAIVASALSAVAGVMIIGGVNHALENGLGSLTYGVLAYLAMVSILFMSGVWSQSLLVGLGHRMVYQLRLQLVQRILNTSLARQEQLGGPALYNVLTRDVTMVANATKQLPVSLYNGLLLLAGISYLAWLSPILFLCTVLLVALGVWGDFKLVGRIKKMMADVRYYDERLFEQYEAVIEGRNELGLSQPRRRHLFDRRLEPAAKGAMDTAIKADLLWAINLNWTTVLVFALIGLVFFLGMTLESITQDVVVGYVLTTMFLRTPIAMILEAIPAVLRGTVALKAIDKLKLADQEQTSNERDEPIQALHFESLSLNKACYEYPTQGDESGFMLGPIDFQLKRGELVFLIGGNGSGKSTLAKLLTGLYLPTSGSVKVNDDLVTHDSVAEYRSCFSTIFPNFFLFDDVLSGANESTLGDEDVKVNSREDYFNERVRHYLERLAIDHKVSIKNGQLSTTSLSQGQRKRLALLLMYMEDRQVLLLDEWAADQDPVFREVFYREILPELKAAGKTIIAISHDDRYFDAADRVYRLDQGGITDFDLHSDSLFHTSIKDSALAESTR
ncbi:cyclic peptide export ABC transporter [Marinomonas mediterranea]|jgi:cyclic peptide transporter|uniref:Cyclic peptide transporter n=1 Tax=Marinomonas mediterranea (strain ATCC 700492 / JCM 21426 / NBRC 103028 / MMB-1) TaxID=717774 RepID=F2K4D5_MARM1|nr:cyclic peptide export ABC transporter [Marinomonas mediterranea]ADZ90234.1 cyclic peptide transporter [Marinomonas mediterranea MMB-1]